MTIESGMEIGPYRIEAAIGQGGMGVVYRALHLRLQRQVAIKVLKGLERGGAAGHRFEREARALALLKHPNILDVFDFGEIDGAPYMVSEYLAGGTLLDRLRGHSLDRPEAVRLMKGVAAALDYAHAQGVVHRDVKPGNVLLDLEERPVLADFGLARILGSTSLTTTGMATGTPAYIAPEQVTNGPITPATDRYSFAAMAYHLVTGQLPFPSDDFVTAMYAHVQDSPVRPTAAAPDLPASVDAILLRGLAKNPASRWDSATEMVDALELALAGRWNEEAATQAKPPVWLAAPRPSGSARPAPPPPPAVELAGIGATSGLATTAALEPAPGGVVTGQYVTVAQPGRRPLPGWLAFAGIALAVGVGGSLLLLAFLRPGQASAAPAMTLSDGVVHTGDALTVTGGHLPAGEPVRVLISPGRRQLANGLTDSAGDIQLVAFIPDNLTPGVHDVRLCWKGACPLGSAVTVLATATPSPLAAAPTLTPAASPQPPAANTSASSSLGAGGTDGQPSGSGLTHRRGKP